MPEMGLACLTLTWSSEIAWDGLALTSLVSAFSLLEISLNGLLEVAASHIILLVD